MKAYQDTPAGSSEVTTAPLTPAVNGAAPTPKPEFRLPSPGLPCPRDFADILREHKPELLSWLVNGGVPTPKPEFIRLPLAGSACSYTGLKRSKLNELVLPCQANGFKPQVRSVCLRQRGAKKGIRLVHYQSLMDYLYSQEVTA
jgi:hypothetical protein